MVVVVGFTCEHGDCSIVSQNPSQTTFEEAELSANENVTWRQEEEMGKEEEGGDGGGIRRWVKRRRGEMKEGTV